MTVQNLNTPTEKRRGYMSRELSVVAEDFAAEVAWLNRPPFESLTPEAKVIEVSSMLGVVLLRRCTAGQQYRESVVPAQGGAQDVAVVDAAKLDAALRGVTGWIGVAVDKGRNQLVISSPARTTRLPISDVEFPPWPSFRSDDEQLKVVIDTGEIARALTSVGTDEAFPTLKKVAFDDGAMVTTDRFRLTRIQFASVGFTAAIAADALRPFLKGDGVVYADLGRCPGVEGVDCVELKSGGRTMLVPASEFEVSWRQLVTVKPSIRLVLSREPLLKAIDGGEVTFTLTPVDDGKVELTVLTVSNEVETEQKIKVEQVLQYDLGEPFTVTMKSKYVREALRGISVGLILLDAIGPDRQVTFQDISKTDLHLIMPVRSESAKAR